MDSDGGLLQRLTDPLNVTICWRSQKRHLPKTHPSLSFLPLPLLLPLLSISSPQHRPVGTLSIKSHSHAFLKWSTHPSISDKPLSSTSSAPSTLGRLLLVLLFAVS